MSLSYTVKESLAGFSRAKLSTFASILTISIALILLGIFAVFSINTSRFMSGLRDKVELEVFLREPVSRQDIGSLQKKMEAIEGIEKAVFVSKDEAAKTFKKEFGEDVGTVLQFNPLPPSFKIYLQEGHKTSEAARRIHAQIKKLNGVDDVVYRKALLELIDRRAATVNTLTLVLGTLIGLSAILLVANTIRLAIYAKRRILRTMELVGATGTFIRLPFILEGIVQGLLGGLLAMVLLYGGLAYVSHQVLPEFSANIGMESTFYLATVAAGVCLGLVGATIAVMRFLRLPEA